MLALNANDNAYFASSRRADLATKRIQLVFDLLLQWLDKWRMAVNVKRQNFDICVMIMFYLFTAAIRDDGAADGIAEGFATSRNTTGGSIDPHAGPDSDFVDTRSSTAGTAHMTASAAGRGPPRYYGWPGPNPSSGLELPGFTAIRTIGIRVGSSGTELCLFTVYRPPHTAWGLRVVSPAGRQFLQDSEDYGYEVVGPDTLSHFPTDLRFGADVLDIVLCHQLLFQIHVEVLYDKDTLFDTDHACYNRPYDSRPPTNILYRLERVLTRTRQAPH
ncbi:hypothetical protein EVAR_23885_1 [Eumeta japonica]|uniref:Uncharacterized protein n=1 Tax=Eumeta variegata TaxID=151549 RepID=A0A4C1V5D1_EUMVA|nr:hypothetical protein EVAR_23885_1 [Eumeta japonica]